MAVVVSVSAEAHLSALELLRPPVDSRPHGWGWGWGARVVPPSSSGSLHLVEQFHRVLAHGRDGKPLAGELDENALGVLWAGL